MKLLDLLRGVVVVFLDVDGRNEAIDLLASALDQAKLLKNKDAFVAAILQREAVVSTYIGSGIAVPHAQLVDGDRFFLAIGIRRAGILWSDKDRSEEGLARLILMLGGPANKQQLYLRLLSGITNLVRDELIRKQFLAIRDQESGLAILGQWEV